MASDRQALPQTEGAFMITDGGLETDLIFHRGFDLPAFAAFPLLEDESGRAALRDYYDAYADIARSAGAGLLLESPTWRANPDWAATLGYDAQRLGQVNRDAIALMREVRAGGGGLTHVVISGQVGPRGDGYVVADAMDAAAAQAYHAPQIEALADGGADMVTAITMTYADEAIGVTRAAQAAGMPVAISFTVETDGRLPDGTSLAQAIGRVDGETAEGPAYYMINCAHPTHFAHVLETGGDWVGRIRGLRANASVKSHAELDEAQELDEGDLDELAAAHERLRDVLPHVSVLGGCCGTDHRHVRRIAGAWLGTGAVPGSA